MFTQFDVSSTSMSFYFFFVLILVVFVMNMNFSFSFMCVMKSVVERVGLIVKVSFVSVFIMVLFGFLFMVNIIGMVPFSFSFSSHAWFSIWVSVSLFLCFVSIWVAKGLLMFVAHFIPVGSPVFLGLGLFWIEVVSLVVRPVTLVLRLSANMLAGHVLLSLLSSAIVVISFNPTVISVVLSCVAALILYWMELFVCLVQAVVFCLLMQSYYMELE